MEKGKAIVEEGNLKLQVLIDRNKKAFPPKQPDWQVVRKKRRYPDHWRPGSAVHNPAVLIPRSKIYVPFQTRPTYAQVVANRGSHTHPFKPTPSSTPATSPTNSSPTSPRSPTYYLSPHSPTPLRFPPSAKFGEWKGRCFRCCRTGHSIATCRNSPKCGRCWKSGHTGNRCRAEATKQAPMPAGKPRIVDEDRVKSNEPSFAKLLTEPKLVGPPPMPEGRPETIKCFIDRDDEFYHEMDRLNSAVVVHTSELAINFELSVDKIVEWVGKANLIPENEIVIAALTKGRFLIILSEGLAPEVLIEAIPYKVWDEGISFQRWDPLEDRETVVPEFKTMVDLIGIPPALYREKAVINAVSNFGLYLGTVAQPNQANISAWTAVVATEKLEDIPLSVTMFAGPIKYPVEIRPVNWKKGPVFREDELLQWPTKFKKPPKPVQEILVQPTSGDIKTSKEMEEEDDWFPMSRRVLLELCQGRDPDTLPPKIREMITGEDNPFSAVHGMASEKTGPDPAIEEIGVANAVPVQSTPISPERLNKESQEISNVITNEEQEMVRADMGIKCSEGKLSGDNLIGETLLGDQDNEAGHQTNKQQTTTPLAIGEGPESGLGVIQQNDFVPCVPLGTEGVLEAEAEGLDLQEALNASLCHGKGPQTDSQPLGVLRRLERQKRKKNSGLFNQVLGRPKVIMGFM